MGLKGSPMPSQLIELVETMGAVISVIKIENLSKMRWTNLQKKKSKIF